MIAPIVLFVFARPDHTRRTLKALAANDLASQSDLFIYADAARNIDEVGRVSAVRALIYDVKGFRSVSVIERKTNYGLARNIIEGVTQVCVRHGCVIVLEDDIETSPHFLTYMNLALNKYSHDPKVWHVSGWNYPIDPEGLEDAFFWRVMNCWGWATWADRWQHFHKDPVQLIQTWSAQKIDRFNLDGSYEFWNQVKLNFSGEIETWAIFWYATIFDRKGLCLNPAKSLVHNIGHDGSGENCGDSYIFSHVDYPDKIEHFPGRVEESKLAVQKVSSFYSGLQRSVTKRILCRIRAIFSRLIGRSYAK